MRSLRPGFQTTLAIAVCDCRRNDPRLKAWPRGLRPLRYSFASLRMTRLEMACRIGPMHNTVRLLALSISLSIAASLLAADYPAPTEGDFTVRDFKFQSGETLPELHLHYRTLGRPEKDAQGK